MSEELEILTEYAKSFGLLSREITFDDLKALKDNLEENGEFGLANWLTTLSSPEDLKDYIGEGE